MEGQLCLGIISLGDVKIYITKYLKGRQDKISLDRGGLESNIDVPRWAQ